MGAAVSPDAAKLKAHCYIFGAFVEEIKKKTTTKIVQEVESSL
jgi:hypothetical protein